MKKPPKWGGGGEVSSNKNTNPTKQKLGCTKAFDLPTTKKSFLFGSADI
jgi:hypothetical protein